MCVCVICIYPYIHIDLPIHTNICLRMYMYMHTGFVAQVIIITAKQIPFYSTVTLVFVESRSPVDLV